MKRDYLGTGIKFPITLRAGKVVYASEISLIDQSIQIILSTPAKTRVFVPEFGSRLTDLLFDPNDDALESALSYFINEALTEWEKRIKVLGVDFERINEDQTDCTIRYRVLASNEIDSYIYPFYKNLKY